MSASTPDPAPANNTAVAETDVTERDDTLVTKSADGSPHPPGSLLTYTLTIESRGPSIGTYVELLDEIPEHTTFISAVQTCFGGTATFELVVRVDEDVPVGGGSRTRFAPSFSVREIRIPRTTRRP